MKAFRTRNTRCSAKAAWNSLPCSSARLHLAIVLSLLNRAPQALALASSHVDEVWDPYNITQLPTEIRRSLARMCGADLKAQRYFAGYFDNSRFLVLHFGRLHCGERTDLCTQSGCLNQVYERCGSRYRLLKSYYGPRGD